MAERVVIVQGHPDPAASHLLHALADAYAPPNLRQPHEDMRWAQHWMFLFPLWHGTMPALFKGFLEHIFPPGFAMEYARDPTGERG